MFSILLPSICNAEQTIKFAVIADHNDDFGGLERVLNFIATQDVNFMVVPGDYSASGSYYQYYENGGFNIVPGYYPELDDLYFVTGNHDNPPYGGEFFQNDIAPYYPKNGPTFSPEGTIFSFDRGDCHFVITNQYWNISDGGYTQEQLEWIRRDLTESNQSFKFVFGHEPAFPLDRHIGDSLDSEPEIRDSFWKILSENGVQAFFCGHTHHLSTILHDKVYQFDAGEVKSGHICAITVEVNAEIAKVRLYETTGSTPSDDPVFSISIDPYGYNDNRASAGFIEENKDPGTPQILFEGQHEESMCFISTAFGCE